MDETLRGVAKFHEAFAIHVAKDPYMPFPSGDERRKLDQIAELMELTAKWCHDAAEDHPTNIAFLRLQLIQEELSELARAFERGSIHEGLDALTDIQYVLDGTYLSLGLQRLKLPAHREVQRSNMTKLGGDSRPIINAAGRVVKGPNYDPPKLKELLYKMVYGGNIDSPEEEQPR